ncbi:glycosyltransferase [bacterium]|nr:glycosyltransferase [bacterium]
MARLRLLRVIPELHMGGVQRMLLRTLGKLADEEIETEICCVGTDVGAMADRFRERGIPIHHIPAIMHVPYTPRINPVGVWRLRQLVSTRNYDIVHGHMYPANIAVNLALAWRNGSVLINSYHNQMPVVHAWQGHLVRWTCGIPTAWVAVSECVREPLVGLGIPQEKIHIIYNGIDEPPEPEPFQERPENAPIELVWAGRFVRQKRNLFMLDVIEECKRQGVGVNLMLLGEGPMLYKAIHRVADHGLVDCVRFAGMQQNVRPFLGRADLFISTSDREGFPNALIEACAAGRGFLASDIPPHRELLASSGAGLLMGDRVEDWAAAIAGLARERARIVAMGAEAFALSRRYTAGETARRTLDLYRSLVR